MSATNRSSTTKPDSTVDFTPDPNHYPFTSRWFESSVGPVHYIDEGQGRPILLLHGNPDWSFLYRQIISQLKGHFRCVALDYPGFGLSHHPEGYGFTAAEHAAVVTELVDYLDLQDTVLMGQDWGGPIGLEVASQQPNRFSGIALGNTFYQPPDRMMRIFSAVMSSAPIQKRILQRNFFVEKLMRMSIKSRIDEPAFDHYVQTNPTPESRTGFAVFPRQIRDAEPFLEALDKRVKSALATKPTLLFFGRKDPAMGTKRVEKRWRNDFPHATVVELKEAGHYIQEDAPNTIAAEILKKFS